MQSKKTSNLDLNLLTLLLQLSLIKQDLALIEQDLTENLSTFID